MLPHCEFASSVELKIETTVLCCAGVYLYTHTLRSFLRSSARIGRTVAALSVQRLKTSLMRTD
jgi:hypothetical protein